MRPYRKYVINAYLPAVILFDLSIIYRRRRRPHCVRGESTRRARARARERVTRCYLGEVKGGGERGRERKGRNCASERVERKREMGVFNRRAIYRRVESEGPDADVD